MSVTISILTATYNAEASLPGLIECMRGQTCQDFEWVVVDGASSDCTGEMIQGALDVVTKWVSEPDCGIYDALNKALHLAEGDYYLVVGADDRLEPDAVANFKQVAERSTADVIAAKVAKGGKVVARRWGPPWLFGQFAYVAAHSVGTLFRRSLHERFGEYSLRYPVAADQLFIKKIGQAGVSRLDAEFVAGEFGEQGVSSVDVARALSESFRVQLETEAKAPQLVLYILRLVRHFRKL